MQFVTHRSEERSLLQMRVDLCSLDIQHRVHGGITGGFTENVSGHGARVVSSKPWKLNERLKVWSLSGDFRARARVVYCEPLGSYSFAIGLQLLASTGNWN